LLALARRDAVDGKAGAAFSHMTNAISCIEETFNAVDSETPRVGCAMKVLGDLHSFGALLPPDVFVNQIDESSNIHERSERLLREQASFVARGEKAYSAAVEAQIADSEEETDALRSAILCDLGGNILLQGQIRSSAFGESQGATPELSLEDVIGNVDEVKEVYDRAAEVFKSAIDANPLYAPAWCGLGCAVSATDPLLAQHAFCTSLQLDKTLPDSWSNLAFLFAGKEAHVFCAEMLDALTQVADSPLMWICRAILLEKEADVSSSGPSEAKVSRAADAYRAALQVVKHPTALLGLSLTCRVTTGITSNEKYTTYNRISSTLSRQDSFAYVGEYLGASSSCNMGASVLAGVMTLEDGVEKLMNSDISWPYQVVDQGREMIADGMKGISKLSFPASSENDATPSIKVGLDVDVITHIAEPRSATDPGAASTAENSLPAQDLLSPPFDHDLTPARRVIHDPESGELWLDLAKSLAKELLAVSGCKKRKIVEEIVETVILAGDRAAQILSDQVSNPLLLKPVQHVTAKDPGSDGANVSRGVVSVPVDARDVSESLALAYWLETVEIEMLHKSDDARVPKRTMDLQRALFMNPDNKFARQALQNAMQAL
jgi:tetratricopeptide (TPR) repeat protein